MTPEELAAFELLASKFPARFKVKQTKYLRGLLEAFAVGDGYIETQIEAVRDNSLVITARSKHLDRLASNYGVVRGQATGVQDDDFRKLVPVLGMSAKQINHTLQQIIDIIYGPYATHANITCSEPETYDISDSPVLRVRVDGDELNIEFKPTDAVIPSAATVEELATVVSERSQGRVIGSKIINVRTGENFLNIRSSTIGPQGFVQVLGGDAQVIFKFPEIRPTKQDIATWDVTRYAGTDEMRFEVTAGISPALQTAGVRVGDVVTIRSDAGFDAENVGSFEVTHVEEDAFRVRNNEGLPESAITQAHIDDFVFYRADMANVLLSGRPATVLSTGERELTVLLPVTSPIVKRTLRGGHHYHGGVSAVNAVTANTMELGSVSGFQPSGSVRIINSRSAMDGAVSSIGATTITMIDAEGWPSYGSVYSPIDKIFYYYQGISGNTLQNVQPAPSVNLPGTRVKYSDRFKYTGISGLTLTGVFPSPAPALGLEVSANIVLEGDFIGSFLYDKSAPFVISNQVTELEEKIQQGSSKTILEVDDIEDWPETGHFVLQFGSKEQEGPIRYLGKIGTKTLIVDPGHVFDRDHPEGINARLIRQIGTHSPAKNGSDYAVYMTGTSQARALLASYLQSVVAAGVVLKFIVQVPDYKWPVKTLLHAEGPIDTTLV